MHAVHLPPRHLWRSAALAALLTLAFMALLLMTAAQLSVDGGAQSSTPQTQQAAPPAAQPSWLDQPTRFEPLAVPQPLLEAAQAD